MDFEHLLSKNQRFLARFIGGSHLYGLNTQYSDIDYRGVYADFDPKNVFGLLPDGCLGVTKEDGDDYVFFELRKFFKLCKQTNTNSIEMLFVPRDALVFTSPPFEEIQKLRNSLIDSKKLLHSTRGYCGNEARLALGERTGKLGGKRKAQLEKYGFSPKNVCQIIRIVAATSYFLKNGNYPLKLDVGETKTDRDLAFRIKTRPEEFSKEDVEKIVAEYKEKIELQTSDSLGWKFDDDLHASLLDKIYFSK
jgi:predicted nucleotidyltransferase